MTNLNYLEADAALIVACLPEEIDDGSGGAGVATGADAGSGSNHA